MESKEVELSKKDKFKFEREGLDFPFYKDNPRLSIPDWIILVIGFLATLVLLMYPNSVDIILRQSLYVLIPLIAFGIVLRGKFNVIFKKLKREDVKTILIAVVATFILSTAFGLILNSLGIVPVSGPANPYENNIFYWITSIFQLMGEELIKLILLIIPLTILYKITKKRKISVIIATLVCAVIFGTLHLSATGNIIYAIVSIGLADIAIIYAYLKTKNLIVSYLAHLIFDLIFWIPSIIALVPHFIG